jgi:hypothetical protein
MAQFLWVTLDLDFQIILTLPLLSEDIPDLIVHRCLKSLMDNSQPPYNTEELNAIGEKFLTNGKSSSKGRKGFHKNKSMQTYEKFYWTGI